MTKEINDKNHNPKREKKDEENVLFLQIKSDSKKSV